MRERVHVNRRSLAQQWCLTAYGVVAGICACVLAAWASSGIEGGAGVGVWIGLAILLALVAAWFAEHVVSLAAHLSRLGLDQFLIAQRRLPPRIRRF